MQGEQSAVDLTAARGFAEWHASQAVRTAYAAVQAALRTLCAGTAAAALLRSATPQQPPALHPDELRANLMALLSARQAHDQPFFSAGDLAAATAATVPILVDATVGSTTAEQTGWLGSALHGLGITAEQRPVQAFAVRSWPLADRQWLRLVDEGTPLDMEVQALIDAAPAYLRALLSLTLVAWYRSSTAVWSTTPGRCLD